jgi:hypothetical protein
LVGVFTGVSVGVFVGVLVGVFTGVSVGVFVGVLVGVFTGVGVGVGVTHTPPRPSISHDASWTVAHCPQLCTPGVIVLCGTMQNGIEKNLQLQQSFAAGGRGVLVGVCVLVGVRVLVRVGELDGVDDGENEGVGVGVTVAQ